MSSTSIHSTRSLRPALTWLGTLALASAAACAAPPDGAGDGSGLDADEIRERSFSLAEAGQEVRLGSFLATQMRADA